MAAVLLNSRFTFSPRFSEDDFDQSPFALPYIIVPPAVAPTPAKHDVFPELCVQQPQPFSLCMAFDDVISQTMDTILKPYRVATSKPARQTYLNAALFIATSTILLGLAVVAYVLFYFSYIPQIGIERRVHLQYGDGAHPYGLASLETSLISQQPYSIALSLHLPRSPPNLAAGNFMLSLSLLSSSPDFNLSAPLPNPDPSSILFSSRRPAILTYASPLISYSQKLFALPLYILGFRTESETLLVAMAESVSFPRGRKNVPSSLLLELQALDKKIMQIYDVKIIFTAKFEGLRWIMYSHRIMSFVVFVGAFWGAEVIFTILGWVALRSFLGEREKEGEVVKGKKQSWPVEESNIKREPDTDDDPDLSDTPRTFPTYGRQQPLVYTTKPKEEGDEEKIIGEASIQPLGGEADDEDDGEIDVGDFRGRRSDSGLGTSYSEHGEQSGSVRRRPSGKSLREGF